MAILIVPLFMFLYKSRVFVGQGGDGVWTLPIVAAFALFIACIYYLIFSHLCVPTRWIKGRKIAMIADGGVSLAPFRETLLALDGKLVDENVASEFTVRIVHDEAYFESVSGKKQYHLIGSFFGLPPHLLLASELGKFVHRSDRGTNVGLQTDI